VADAHPYVFTDMKSPCTTDADDELYPGAALLEAAAV
jgi:hypothetical protein